MFNNNYSNDLTAFSDLVVTVLYFENKHYSKVFGAP